MSDASICPKCSFPREAGALDCPACGIVYDRYDPDRRSSVSASMGGDMYARVEPRAGSGAQPVQPQQAMGSAAGSGAAGSLYGGGGEVYGGLNPAAAGGADDGLYNPYAAPAVQVSRPGWVNHQPLAERGTRLAARFLDGLSVGVPVFLWAMALGFMAGEAGADEVPAGFGFTGGLLLLYVIGLTIWNIMLLHKQGQTLGKKLMNIQIVRMDGDRAGASRIILLREIAPGLVGAIPILGPIFAIANLLWIFGEERRCLHDHFADTRVVVFQG